jgi:hypothetical protein
MLTVKTPQNTSHQFNCMEGEIVGFRVTTSGALVIFKENQHGTYQLAAFNAGQWAAVEKTPAMPAVMAA